MYTQNISIKSSCDNAKFKEFPNKNAIKQMQTLQNNQTKAENTKITVKTTNCYQNKTQSSSSILMPLVLSLIFCDCDIDNQDIFTILLCGILAL